MSGTTIKATSGRATVEFDMAAVIAQADRISRGAVRSFLAAAHRQMDPIVKSATTDQALWPRRTGDSQSATTQNEGIGRGFVELVARNAVPYTYKMRYSVLTARDIDTQAQHFASATWSKIEQKVDRAGSHTQRGPYAGRGGAKKRVANHFIQAATGGVWKYWWPKADPSLEAIRAAHKGNLIGRHGKGAPNEAVAGKHVWSFRVRLPLKAAEPALIAEAREALTQLAEG